MNTTHYQYADGSANVYRIKPDSLEYVPVKPEESSTGMYRGGEPKKVALTPEEFRTLKNLLETAQTKHEVHIAERIKTSGMITTFSGSGRTNFILQPGCNEMKEIERALKQLLN